MTSRRNDIEDIIPQEEDTLGKTFSRRGSISAVMNLGNRSLAPNVCHPQYLENFREHFSSIFLVSLAKHLWLCCKLKQENADFFVPHITFQQTTLAPHLWNHEVRYPLYHTHTHIKPGSRHRPCCMWPWRSKVEPTREFHGVATSGADLRESHRSGSRWGMEGDWVEDHLRTVRG